MANCQTKSELLQMSNDHEPIKPTRIERFFFLQTTFGILLTLLLIVGGLFAYNSLVKESFPDLDIPQATISTSWAGADPQSIEQEITDPIETEVKSIKGVKSVTSASFDSFSLVAVEFLASADPKESMDLLRAALNDAEGKISSEAEKPTINQVSVDDLPIMSITLYGDVDKAILGRAAVDLRNQLERLQGVNEVELGGLREEVIQILLNPERLLSLGISPTKVRDAVQAANLDMPWGAIENEQIGAKVRLSGRFKNVSELRALPITRLENGQGRLVRLGELGEVRRELEAETRRALFSWKGGKFNPTIEVSIKKSPGADTIAVIKQVRQALTEMKNGSSWPQAMDYEITQDQSEQISDSLGDVFNNAWQAMIAVFVILLLLLSWREGLVAGLAIPLTFLGALLIIWFFDFSLNQLVIIGMVLALGLLVDVFILMMEGLHEGIFVEKIGFNQSALKTIRQYAVPAAAGQLTTILALAPLMAIGGTAGKFIQVLPMAAIACLVMAFIVALLVAVPLSRFVLGNVNTNKEDAKETKADILTKKYSAALQKWSLKTTLRNRWIAGACVGGAVSVFIISIMAFMTVPMVMYPPSDGLKLGITIEMPPSTTLKKSQEIATRIGEIVRAKPYLESAVMLVGQKSPFASQGLADALSPSSGQYFIGFSCIFVERDARDKEAFEYVDDLRAEIADLLDNNYAAAQLALAAETGGPDAGSPLEITLLGDDMGELQRISKEVQGKLAQIYGVTEVKDNVGALQAEIALKPDREAIDFYGITQRDLAAQIRYAMSSDTIGKFAVSDVKDDLDIKLGMAWPSRHGKSGGPTQMEELSLVRAFTPQGESVSLLSLLEPRMDMAPVSIIHKGAKRAVSVLGKANSERTPGEIIAEFTPTLNDMQKSWPSGYKYTVGGEAQETAETFASAGAMLIVAIILVFSVLVLVFGSFLQSLIIIATMPLAMIGTFLGFFALQIPFSFFAMVGVIALIGIVINDAIVMIDTMNRYLTKGFAVSEAAAHGASDRLRPIISTSLTTIVGLIPLAISDPMWRPLCYAVIFGLIASTVLTLVIVPCLYMLFTRNSRTQPSEGENNTSHQPSY